MKVRRLTRATHFHFDRTGRKTRDMTTIAHYMDEASVYLDPLSISQRLCHKKAPHIAYRDRTRPTLWHVAQGCCNDWLCPRCGRIRAKREYGRMVTGCNTLHDDYGELYFITITTKGRGLSPKVASCNYLTWTNHLLTILRQAAKANEQPWHYVQVTEYQKRKHPHSHILTTYRPGVLYEATQRKWFIDNAGKRRYKNVPCLRSAKLEGALERSGLGSIYDVSIVDDAAAASRYVAKYLFKDAMITQWPKGWRRVRYSRSFPKLPDRETNGFPLLSHVDYAKLARVAIVLQPENEIVLAEIERYCAGSDLLIDYAAIDNARE